MTTLALRSGSRTCGEPLHVDVFYSRIYPRSVEYAKALQQVFPHELSAAFHDLSQGEGAALWAGWGLQSVPSVVFARGGRVVSNIVRYAKFEEVLSRLSAVSTGTYDDGRSDQDGDTASELDYAVHDSSGVHRYARWNEEYVHSADPKTGWCAPSRKSWQNEYLDLDLLGQCRIDRVVLLPRQRDDCLASFLSFPKRLALLGLPRGGEWACLWRCGEIATSEAEAFEIRLAQSGEYCRLRFVVEEPHRIDGYSYPCIAQIRLFGKRYGRTPRGLREISEARLQRYHHEEPYKTGIYAGPAAVVELHNLCRGQCVPASCTKTDRLLVIREGSVQVSVGADGDSRTLQPGAVAILEADVQFAISSVGERASFMLVADPRVPILWEARSKSSELVADSHEESCERRDAAAPLHERMG